jgi:hypothetical protein
LKQSNKENREEALMRERNTGRREKELKKGNETKQR